MKKWLKRKVGRGLAMRKFALIVVCGLVVAVLFPFFTAAVDWTPNLTLVGKTSTTVGLSWDYCYDPTFDYYEVHWKPSTSSAWSWSSDPIHSPGMTTYTVRGLEPATVYEFRVRVVTNPWGFMYSDYITTMTEESPSTDSGSPPPDNSNPETDWLPFIIGGAIIVICVGIATVGYVFTRPKQPPAPPQQPRYPPPPPPTP